jgi:hypothetical protein
MWSLCRGPRVSEGVWEKGERGGEYVMEEGDGGKVMAVVGAWDFT